MSTTEVLEGRVYMTENRMFTVAGRLAAHLYQVEAEVADLHAANHELVCERGRMPIEEKTSEAWSGWAGRSSRWIWGSSARSAERSSR